MTQSSDFPELEAALARAKQRRGEAADALGGPHEGGEMEAYFAADEELLMVERALAAARGQPHAVPIAFAARWSRGAPLPHLLRNDHRALLLFVVEEVDPAWDGTSARIVGPTTEREIAVVEFHNCVSAKLGMPNDEAFHGHPLAGRGLRAYEAFEVVNSPWVAELAAINAVHSRDDPAFWAELSHFILGFHDSTFECVARAFRVETRRGTIADALMEACRKLIA